MTHRWSAAVLAVLACAGAFGQAPEERGADSKLLEILRRRGVIDAAEYEEVKKELDAEVRRSDLDAALDARLDEMTARVVQDAPKISYKPGTGFGFKTADGNFALSIGGRLQARFTYSIDDDNDEDLPDFATPRARIWLKGHAFDPRLTYEFQFDVNGDVPRGSVATGTTASPAIPGTTLSSTSTFTGADRLVELKDAFLNYEVAGKAFQAKMGQFKAPYSRQQLTSSGRQQFVDRSPIDGFFAPGRQKGAMAWGVLGGEKDDLFEYYAGAFNGEGENLANNDEGLMWVGRVAVNPFGGVPYSESDLRAEEDRGALRAALGVDAWYHQNDGRTAANDDAWSVGVDLAAMWHGFTLSGEYHYRETDPAGAAPFDMELDGWFAQAGYMIVPQTFEIAFRYAEVDWSNVVSAAGQTAAREYLIVLGYFWNDHSLKAQLDFGRVENRFLSGNAEDEYRVRLQFQIIF